MHELHAHSRMYIAYDMLCRLMHGIGSMHTTPTRSAPWVGICGPSRGPAGSWGTLGTVGMPLPIADARAICREFVIIAGVRGATGGAIGGAIGATGTGAAAAIGTGGLASSPAFLFLSTEVVPFPVPTFDLDA